MPLVFEEVALDDDSQAPRCALVKPHKLSGPEQVLVVLRILILFVASSRG